jgi:hypothetical protein
MRKLLFYTTFLIFFSNCKTKQGSVIEESSNSKNIIGNSTLILESEISIFDKSGEIKYGLEISQNDFPYPMKYKDAIDSCNALGDGWRIPTKSELDFIYIYKVRGNLKGFAKLTYWSNQKYLGSCISNDCILNKSFYDGSDQISLPQDENLVRAVRSWPYKNKQGVEVYPPQKKNPIIRD